MTISNNVSKMINKDRICGWTVPLNHCPFTSRLWFSDWYRLSQPSLTNQCGETCRSPCWGLEIAPCFVWKGSEEWDWVLGRCYGTGGTHMTNADKRDVTAGPFTRLFQRHFSAYFWLLLSHSWLHMCTCTNNALQQWGGDRARYTSFQTAFSLLVYSIFPFSSF